MESYVHLADFYDILMEDIDYKQWVDYIIEIFNNFSIEPKKILDAACGTGNITIPLVQNGYDVWGVDISQEMLTVAEKKAREEKLKTRFLNQDITKLQLNKKFDAFLCMCDGVNYILEDSDLKKFFNKVYDHLECNGIFIFDISSYYKLSTILGNNVLYQIKNNIYYIWDNIFNEEASTVEMNIDFFVPEGKLFRRFEEIHTQRAYTECEIKNMLSASGFALLGIYDEFTLNDSNQESERIFFVARKA